MATFAATSAVNMYYLWPQTSGLGITLYTPTASLYGGVYNGTNIAVLAFSPTADFTYSGVTPTGGTYQQITLYDTAAGFALLGTLTGISGALTAFNSTFLGDVFSSPSLLGGADTINIAAGAAGSVLFSGDGNDTFVAESAAGLAFTAIDGGNGTDTLSLVPLGSSVVLTGLSSARIPVVEVLSLALTTNVAYDPTSLFFANFTTVTNLAGIQHTAGGTTDLSGKTLSGTPFTQFFGSSGTDTFTLPTAYASAVVLAGQDGDDTLSAGAANDQLFGGDGNDRLIGGGGADYFDGGSGNDAFVGGAGNDYIVGRSGNDAIDYGAEQSLGGTERVVVNLGATAINFFNILTAAAGVATDTTGGTDTLLSIEDVVGTSLPDIIFGNTDNNALLGGDGNDNLDPGAGGTDYINGGAGTQDAVMFLSATAGVTVNLNLLTQSIGGRNVTIEGVERLYGSDFNDVLTGFVDQPNWLWGWLGNDTLTGGSANDFFLGDVGADTMIGGQGNDIYSVDNVGDVVIETAGQGNDGVLAEVDLTLGANIEGLQLFGAAVFGYGNALDNIIYGNANNNTLWGADGNDDVRGFAGNDVVFGMSGDDDLYGGVGNDTVDGDIGNDIVRGELGNDLLVGGAGNDILFGGKGLDTASFASTKAASTVSRNMNGSATVAGPDGTDTLWDVRVARFTDGDVTLAMKPKDFSGNGYADIVFNNAGFGNSLFTWTVVENAVASQAATALLGSTVVVRASGDVNGDGRADLIIQSEVNGTPGVYFMNGSAVASTAFFGSPGANWVIRGSGDLDGDGRSDIVFQNETGQIFGWLMDGATIKSQGFISSSGTTSTVAAVNDFNGDGRADLLVRGTDGSNSILAMNGLTVSSTTATTSIASGFAVAATGDFNNDWRNDIVWRNATTGEAQVWTMNGATVTGTGSFNPGTAWAPVSAANYSGDSTAELLWYNSSTTEVAIWEMNGTSFAGFTSLGAVGTGWNVVA